MSLTSPGIQRVAIWMAHSRKCAYCAELVQFRDLEIDHIIPESLGKRPEDLNRLRTELGLSSEFTLNSLGNLLPCHAMCNARKRDQIFEHSRIRFFLEVAAGKVDAIGRLIPDLELEASKERLLTAVQAGFESGNLNVAELIGAATQTTGFPLLTAIEFEGGSWTARTDSKQVDQLLDSPVVIGSVPQPDGVRFVTATGSLMMVKTCREYRAALAAGFYPADNAQLKMSFFLMMASAILEAALRARVAATSYIQSPHRGVADLYLLPVVLVANLKNAAREDESLLAMGSIHQLSEAKKLTIISVSSSCLVVELDGFGTVLEEMMRADMDGDGIEEILIERTIYAVKGTFRHYEVGLLRRTEPNVGFVFEDWTPNEDWMRAQTTAQIARIMR